MTQAPVVPTINTNVSTPSSNDDNVNPFESPRAYSSDNSTTSLPSRPQKAALPISSTKRYMAKEQRKTDSVAERDNDILGAEQESFDEKRWSHKKGPASVDRTSRHAPSDPEKAGSPRTSQPQLYMSDRRSIQRSGESIHEEQSLQAQKALSILLYLSGPCVLLSFLTTIWAVLSMLVTLLYQPLRLCTPRLPIGHQISHFLAPTLNLHLRCIYAPVYSRPSEDNELYSAGWLLIVHLVAPVISLGTMIAAWVVAMYWGLARIVGDPSGVDKKDDSVEAVLGLTRFWQSLLMKGVLVQQ